MIRTGCCFFAVISERRPRRILLRRVMERERDSHLEGEQDLFEEFEDGSGIGSDGDNPVLRGVKRRRGIPQRGGFPCSDLSGNDTNGTEFEGIEESVCEGLVGTQRDAHENTRF